MRRIVLRFTRLLLLLLRFWMLAVVVVKRLAPLDLGEGQALVVSRVTDDDETQLRVALQARVAHDGDRAVAGLAALAAAPALARRGRFNAQHKYVAHPASSAAGAAGAETQRLV